MNKFFSYFQKRLHKKNKIAPEESLVQVSKNLSQLTAKDIMIPRVDMIALDIDTPYDEFLKTVSNSPHSRFPVFKSSIDEVSGILYVKDLLKSIVLKKKFELTEMIRDPLFVPETIRLDKLLGEMKRRRVHLSIVVDEYGGVSGLACMEDIIEEIVGEIEDEFDSYQEKLVRLDDMSFLIDGRIPIAELNQTISTDIPEDNFDTIGGFVYDMFGKIPTRYEKRTYKDYTFIIQAMEGNKIKTIKLVVSK